MIRYSDLLIFKKQQSIENKKGEVGFVIGGDGKQL